MQAHSRIDFGILLSGVLSATLATILVVFHNLSLWETAPFPLSKPAREAIQECPWVVPGIARLQATYSVPIWLIVFFSVFGFGVTFLRYRHLSGLLLSGAYLYPFVGYPLGILLLPLFGGLALAVYILVRPAARLAFSSLTLPSGALALNTGFIVVTWHYYSDWFSVFGD